jgi:hypothetical protein
MTPSARDHLLFAAFIALFILGLGVGAVNLQLTPDEHSVLAWLAREGSAPLGRSGVPLSAAIRFQMAGLAHTDRDGEGRQRVTINQSGRAFARRNAA